MEQLNELLELIENHSLAELRSRLSDMNAVDIAEFMSHLEKEKSLVVFRVLPKDLAVDVFSYMTTDQQQHVVESVSDREVRALVDGLFLDDTVDFLEEVPANIVKKVLKNTDEGTRRLINQFLQYPENSAGSKMTIEFVDLKTQMTAREAIEDIRKTGVDKETVYTCYAIDDKRRLVGSVALHKLLVSPEDALVGDIMDESVLSVRTQDDQEIAADLARKYDLLAVPVVDSENRLVGIITVDDLIDVMEEETTEDIEKMAALSPSEDEYMRTSVITLAKNRVIWLLVLMISGTISGFVITRFQHVLAQVLVLTSFIPVLMDSGGNAGSQAAILIIRGMALGEIFPRDALKVLSKEFRVAMICGTTLAVVNFFRLVLFAHEVTPIIALVMSLALLVTVMLAKTVGSMLPILAKFAHVDPALMASPLITTIVDVLSLLVYFTLATNILHIG